MIYAFRSKYSYALFMREFFFNVQASRRVTVRCKDMCALAKIVCWANSWQRIFFCSFIFKEKIMNAKMTAVALAVTLGLSAGAANASTTWNGFSANKSGYDATFGNDSVTGSFSDSYLFTSPIDANGGAIAVTGFGTFGVTTQFTSFSLIDTNGGATIASGSGLPANLSTMNFSGLNTADIYKLTVAGDLVSGISHGSYTGSVSIDPVPEPAESALMLSGLGLLGFIAARSK